MVRPKNFSNEIPAKFRAQKTTKREKKQKQRGKTTRIVYNDNNNELYIKVHETERNMKRCCRRRTLSLSLSLRHFISAPVCLLSAPSFITPSSSISIPLSPLLHLVCLGSSSCLALDNRRLLFKCAASCDSSCVTGANNIS